MKRIGVILAVVALVSLTGRAYAATWQGEIFSELQGGLSVGRVIDVTFTDADLTDALNAELASIKRNNFVESISVHTVPGSTEIRAKVSKPMKTTLVVKGSAVLGGDGTLMPKITSVRLGYLPIPVSFVEIIGSYLMYRSSPREWFSVPGAKWERFELGEGNVSIRVVGFE